MASKGPLGRPKVSPRGPQEGPRGAEGVPRGVQGEPRDCPGEVQEKLRGGPEGFQGCSVEPGGGKAEGEWIETFEMRTSLFNLFRRTINIATRMTSASDFATKLPAAEHREGALQSHNALMGERNCRLFRLQY